MDDEERPRQPFPLGFGGIICHENSGVNYCLGTFKGPYCCLRGCPFRVQVRGENTSECHLCSFPSRYRTEPLRPGFCSSVFCPSPSIGSRTLTSGCVEANSRSHWALRS